jgi:predicted amidohydrolase YtcJ
VGTRDDIMKLAGAQTTVIDLNGRRAIPGLIDSHMHIIRGGLNYNMELRWDGVRSLADAMRMLKDQVDRTPRRNGCAWSAASPSTSSPRSACRPSTN